MQNLTPANSSHLFLIRLWQQPSSGAVEWRGRVQHMITGESHEFRDWVSLIYHINDIMADSGGDTPPGDQLGGQGTA